MKINNKVFVLGIDGAFPEFLFGSWLDELPNIRKLISNGGYAKLNSTTPPLSGTAWTSIITGKTPTDTGIFEYIHRKNFSYFNWRVTTFKNVKEKTIWQIATENNKQSVICYVPISWPVKPLKGHLISGSLTPPGPNIESTYPIELKKELEDMFNEQILFDVPKFRDLLKEEIIEEVYKLTGRHIEIMKYLLIKKEWDLFFGVIGLSDRMNHTFWRYMDKEHRKYDPNSKYINVLKDYYKFLDNKLGELLNILDKDTKIILLSDHGIIRMHSRVNLTDWLIQNRYMTLKSQVKEKKVFDFNMVDWSKTKVFAIGAYEGQIFLNLKGREPEGIVKEEEYDKIVDELIEKLSTITGDRGEKLDNRFFKKKEFFKGKLDYHAPDLMIYFDDLQYGCNNSIIGNETLWSPQTAKGSDDAGHSKQGIFIINNGEGKSRALGEISYLDVAPTILHMMGLPIPADMKGKVIK